MHEVINWYRPHTKYQKVMYFAGVCTVHSGVCIPPQKADLPSRQMFPSEGTPPPPNTVNKRRLWQMYSFPGQRPKNRDSPSRTEIPTPVNRQRPVKTLPSPYFVCEKCSIRAKRHEFFWLPFRAIFLSIHEGGHYSLQPPPPPPSRSWISYWHIQAICVSRWLYLLWHFILQVKLVDAIFCHSVECSPCALCHYPDHKGRLLNQTLRAMSH